MFMSIQDEFQFINKVRPSYLHNSTIKVGIGDDGAVYETSSEYDQVVCQDSMVEGIHFTTKTMSAYDIGYKCLAVNLSDIAAMGAIPKYCLVSIAIPKHWAEQELSALYDGLKELANQYKVDVIGGDTTSSMSGLFLSVTVIGVVEKGRAILRQTAQPGDVVFVTGTLGDSAAGLNILLESVKDTYSKDEEFLIHRHQRPVPQIGIGRKLVHFERACLNDISDGLASELHEIAESSQVSIRINRDKIPLSRAIQNFDESKKWTWALTGGEDFELVGSLPPSDYELFKQQCEREGVHISDIGSVLPKGEHPVLILEEGKEHPLQKGGYNHFKK